MAGGSTGNGTIWKEVSEKGKETILHNFCRGFERRLRYPYGGVARDATGNLYGVTYGCGANGDTGRCARLSTRAARLTLLHSFDLLRRDLADRRSAAEWAKGRFTCTTSPWAAPYVQLMVTVWSCVP